MAKNSRAEAKAARPSTVAAYLASLTPERRAVIEEARALVHRHIPKGYAEFMNWGVINWGIPLEEFSNTRNGQPLCYVGFGAAHERARVARGGDDPPIYLGHPSLGNRFVIFTAFAK